MQGAAQAVALALLCLPEDRVFNLVSSKLAVLLIFSLCFHFYSFLALTPSSDACDNVVYALLDQQFVLTCSIPGEQPSEVIWLKDGQSAFENGMLPSKLCLSKKY